MESGYELTLLEITALRATPADLWERVAEQIDPRLQKMSFPGPAREEELMSRRMKQAAVVFVVVFAAAQLVRPERANPATDVKPHDSGARGNGERTGRRPGSRVPRLSLERDRVAVVHAIAPVSWLMAYGVTEGRKAVNFSEWAAYPPEQQRTLLAASCQDVSDGKMPGRLHAAASGNAALGPGRRDDLRGGAPGRSERSRRTVSRPSSASNFCRWRPTGRPQCQPRDDVDRRCWRKQWATWN